jgi:hypothetical protein
MNQNRLLFIQVQTLLPPSIHYKWTENIDTIFKQPMEIHRGPILTKSSIESKDNSNFTKYNYFHLQSEKGATWEFAKELQIQADSVGPIVARPGVHLLILTPSSLPVKKHRKFRK